MRFNVHSVFAVYYRDIGLQPGFIQKHTKHLTLMDKRKQQDILYRAGGFTVSRSKYK